MSTRCPLLPPTGGKTPCRLVSSGQLCPLRTLALVPQALIPSPLSTSWSQLGIGSCRGDDALGQCEVEG